MSRARRQQYMLRTEASEQEAKKSTFTSGPARTRQGYDVCMECEKKFINWVEDEKRKAKE